MRAVVVLDHCSELWKAEAAKMKAFVKEMLGNVSVQCHGEQRCECALCAAQVGSVSIRTKQFVE